MEAEKEKKEIYDKVIKYSSSRVWKSPYHTVKPNPIIDHKREYE